MNLMRWMCCAVLLAAIPGAVRAQDGARPGAAEVETGPDWIVGAGAGFMVLSSSGTITVGDGRVENCCSFTAGDGGGFTAGLRVWRALGESVSMMGGVSFAQWTTTQERRARYLILTGDDLVTDATFAQTLETSIGLAVIDLVGVYHVGWGGVYAGAGPSFALPLAQSHRLDERIVDPPGAVFLSGGREHVLFDDDRTLARSGLRALLVAGTLLPVGNLLVGVQAEYALPLTSMGSGMTWKFGGVAVEAGVLFRF
jgi:hypothetical protein